MYNIYFDNRLLSICNQKEDANEKNQKVLHCKNKKSFDNAYNLFTNETDISEMYVVSDSPEKLFKHLRKKFKRINAAGGVVMNNTQNLLVIKRNGFWDLPKGKIETNEQKKAAAIREVEEECGISNVKIESKLIKTYHTYSFKDKNIFKTTFWYKMKYEGIETLTPQTEEGISEVKWIDKSMIDEIVQHTFESLKPLFFKAYD